MKISVFLLCFLFFACSDNPQKKQIATLCINEVMARNNTVLSPTGASSDWIELYNYGSDTLFLADYFLTDCIDAPYKKSLPTVSVAPGDFCLLWGEKSSKGGNDHFLDFAIHKEETIYLFNRYQELVDSVDLSRLETIKKSKSYGRFPDAGTRWGEQDKPSPKQINEG